MIFGAISDRFFHNLFVISEKDPIYFLAGYAPLTRESLPARELKRSKHRAKVKTRPDQKAPPFRPGGAFSFEFNPDF